MWIKHIVGICTTKCIQNAILSASSVWSVLSSMLVLYDHDKGWSDGGFGQAINPVTPNMMHTQWFLVVEEGNVGRRTWQKWQDEMDIRRCPVNILHHDRQ